MSDRKYPPTPALQTWLENATPAMADKLALLAETATSMYRQWIPGRRGISADVAGRLEWASKKVKLQDPAAPEPMLRGDLCDACRRCDYFRSRNK